MKKTILTIIIGVLIGTMANVLASSLLASNIEYHPKDSKWNVSNVEAAIDSLYYYDTIKTPVGEIINYMGTIVPEHYLECDGKTYKISDYPILAEHIKTNFGSYNKFGGDGTTTFAVPDLRGEFLRGTGTNSHANQGSGADVGVHQDGTAFAHIFNANKGGLYSYRSLSTNDSSWTDPQYADKTYGTVLSQATFSGNITSASGSYAKYTSRPTNTSVMYAIRYE
ncbi:MAG: tail fiber protein [Bacilli bacterium]|nr:tail fiber protein [Bacilli bacterium]